jgi:large subunit ribosomal protein L3
MKALLGTKIGMTQVLTEDGTITPVTILQVGPCVVTQVKTSEKDGYNALQLAVDGGKNVSKPLAGHVSKAKKDLMPRIIKEFRDLSVEDEEQMKVGSSFDVSQFAVGDTVKVTGTSKGKGFAGTVKRHNFATSANTHGGNGMVRRPGSIGSMYPQKVFKGKRMAGQMGNEQVTVSGLKVAYIDLEKNLLGVKGAVPGPKKSNVVVVGA